MSAALGALRDRRALELGYRRPLETKQSERGCGWSCQLWRGFKRLYRRAAFYIDRIVEGTKLDDLMVEQASQMWVVSSLERTTRGSLSLAPPLVAVVGFGLERRRPVARRPKRLRVLPGDIVAGTFVDRCPKLMDAAPQNGGATWDLAI